MLHPTSQLFDIYSEVGDAVISPLMGRGADAKPEISTANFILMVRIHSV